MGKKIFWKRDYASIKVKKFPPKVRYHIYFENGEAKLDEIGKKMMEEIENRNKKQNIL